MYNRSATTNGMSIRYETANTPSREDAHGYACINSSELNESNRGQPSDHGNAIYEQMVDQPNVEAPSSRVYTDLDFIGKNTKDPLYSNQGHET